MSAFWPADGDALDLKNGLNATFKGIVKYSPGKVGSAFDFNGVDSYVIKTNALAVKVTDGWSISGWFYWRGRVPTKHEENLIYNGNPGAHGFGLLIPENGLTSAVPELQTFGGKLVILFGNVRYYPTQIELDQNQWTHIVLMRDSGVLKLFKNGDVVFSVSSVSPNPPSATDGWTSLGFNSDTSINGLVDEVAFFEKALSDNEVLALFAAGSGGITKRPQFTRAVRQGEVFYLHVKGVTDYGLSLERKSEDGWVSLDSRAVLGGFDVFADFANKPSAFYRLSQPKP
jgi:hypothetical protein